MVDNLSWEGSSKTMYDKLLESAPAFMRDQAKKGFEDWVAKKGITTMTEALLEEHIKETAPAPMQAMILAQLQQFKSK
jgi:hypothetical protein